MAPIVDFILAHQGDAADPELLHWIKDRLDQIFGGGPWAVVAIMGFIIVSIPALVVIFYLMQSKRRTDYTPPEPDVAIQDVQDREQVP